MSNQGLRVRNLDDGKLNGSRLQIEPLGGILTIPDDGTGFVSASTPSAQVVKAAPVAVGTTFTGMTGSVTNGTLTATRNGLYVVSAMGTTLSGNASILTFEILVNGSSVASTAAGGGKILSTFNMLATAATLGWSIPQSVVSLNVGDNVSLAVTGSVGTVTIKNMRLLCLQLTDATVAAVV